MTPSPQKGKSHVRGALSTILLGKHFYIEHISDVQVGQELPGRCMFGLEVRQTITVLSVCSLSSVALLLVYSQKINR